MRLLASISVVCGAVCQLLCKIGEEYACTYLLLDIIKKRIDINSLKIVSEAIIVRKGRFPYAVGGG